jgi:hypothetical protein
LAITARGNSFWLILIVVVWNKRQSLAPLSTGIPRALTCPFDHDLIHI